MFRVKVYCEVLFILESFRASFTRKSGFNICMLRLDVDGKGWLVLETFWARFTRKTGLYLHVFGVEVSCKTFLVFKGLWANVSNTFCMFWCFICFDGWCSVFSMAFLRFFLEIAFPKSLLEESLPLVSIKISSSLEYILLAKYFLVFVDWFGKESVTTVY